MNEKSGSASPVLRTCIGCRHVQPREKLLRISLKRGRVSLDPNNRAEGRGAYICKTLECLLSLRAKKKAFSRAFKQSVADQGLEDFFLELSDVLHDLKVDEAIDDNKSNLNDKRHN